MWHATLARWTTGGFLTLLIALATAIDLPAGADPAGGEEREAAGEAQDSGAAPEIPPEMVAPFIARSYAIRPKKLWKGILVALPEAGYPPEVVEEKAFSIKTSFVDFESQNFERNPADPPLPLGSRNYIITMKEIRAGKVSLQIEIGKVPGGAELRVRARILVEGLDRRHRVRVLTDRRSSGAIEENLLKKLEARLELEAL